MNWELIFCRDPSYHLTIVPYGGTGEARTLASVYHRPGNLAGSSLHQLEYRSIFLFSNKGGETRTPSHGVGARWLTINRHPYILWSERTDLNCRKCSRLLPQMLVLQTSALNQTWRRSLAVDIGYDPIQPCFRGRCTSNYANPLYFCYRWQRMRDSNSRRGDQNPMC